MNGGDDEVEEDDGREHPRLYSFTKDGNFIYAAFRQTHGIDLTSANLHWWQFLALFMDLGSDTAFCNLVAFRKRIKNGTATKEEVKQYRENISVMDIPEPDTRTLAQKIQDAEIERLLKSKWENQKNTTPK